MTNEIAIKQETALSTQTAPVGFDNFEMDDLIIPRIRLLQALSQAVSDGKGKMGDIQDSLTEENLGQSIEIVLLNFKNSAVMFKTGEGLVCKSNDGIIGKDGIECIHCPFGEYHGKFHDDGRPPACAATKEFLVVKRSSLSESPYPMLLSFLKTSYPLGKRLISMARLTGEDIYNYSYILSSGIDKNKKGTFATFKISKKDKLSQEEAQAAANVYRLLLNKKIQAHDDTEFVTEV